MLILIRLILKHCYSSLPAIYFRGAVMGGARCTQAHGHPIIEDRMEYYYIEPNQCNIYYLILAHSTFLFEPTQYFYHNYTLDLFLRGPQLVGRVLDYLPHFSKLPSYQVTFFTFDKTQLTQMNKPNLYKLKNLLVKGTHLVGEPTW